MTLKISIDKLERQFRNLNKKRRNATKPGFQRFNQDSIDVTRIKIER